MPMELLKKEIRFRGGRRGIKELDVIFGTFIDTQLDSLNEEELTQLRDLLLQSDLDLFAWFENGEAPVAVKTPLFDKMYNHIKAGGTK